MGTRCEILAGPDAGKHFPLQAGQAFHVGRGSQCEIRIADPRLSRRHARLLLRNGKATIEDLGSRNGTFVDGRQVERAVLDEQSEIRIGDTIMRLSTPQEPLTAESTMGTPPLRVLASYPREEADLLSQPSVSIEPADMQKENLLLRALCELSAALATAGAGEGRSPVDAALDHARRLLEADTACLLLWSEALGDWTASAVSGRRTDPEAPPISRTIVAYCLRDDVAVLTVDALADKRFSASASIVEQRIASAICVPVHMEDECVGALCVNRRDMHRPLGEMDLRFCATVANLLGVFLERNRLHDELVAQERLAAVGQVMAGLAHCAKNIITGLRLSMDALMRLIERQRYDQLAPCAQAMRTEERRLTELILDMLTYVKDRRPMRQPVVLSEVLREVAGTLQPLLDKARVRLEIDLADSLPVLEVEKLALHRVFLNLLHNAVDAFKDKPPDSGPRRIRVTASPSSAAGTVAIVVHDTGCGIPAADLGRVFSVFFSTKGAEGTGLGLAVTRKIIEEHGGRITVQSRAGAWTEFRIDLPVRGEDEEEEEEPDRDDG